MPAPTNPFPGFSQMLRQTLSGALDPRAATFLDMMAEDGLMEFPYAPPGGTRRVQGREALQAYLGTIAGMIEIEGISEPTVHWTRDPNVVILEFEGHGRLKATGLPYEQRYISVITLSEGRIARYVDYWNPLALSPSSDDAQATG